MQFYHFVIYWLGFSILNELAHSICNGFLHLVGYVHIGVHCKACVGMTEHVRYRLDVHSLLKRERGEGGAQIVEEDLPCNEQDVLPEFVVTEDGVF